MSLAGDIDPTPPVPLRRRIARWFIQLMCPVEIAILQNELRQKQDEYLRQLVELQEERVFNRSRVETIEHLRGQVRQLASVFTATNRPLPTVSMMSINDARQAGLETLRARLSAILGMISWDPNQLLFKIDLVPESTDPALLQSLYLIRDLQMRRVGGNLIELESLTLPTSSPEPTVNPPGRFTI